MGALSLALLFLLALVSMRIRLSWSLLVFIATAVAAESAGLWLYDAKAVVFETVPLHIGLLCLTGATIAVELDGRRMRAAQAKVVIDNYRSVLGQVFEDSFDAVVVAADDGRVEFASAQATKLFDGIGSPCKVGALLAEVLPAVIHEEAAAMLSQLKQEERPATRLQRCSITSAAGQQLEIEYVVTPSHLQREDGETNPASAVCITARDVTELTAKTNKLEFLAQHDPLTGVLRREAFVGAIDEMLQRTDREGEPIEIAVVAASLSHFAVINGNFGRSIGDMVLAETAKRIALFAGHRDRVARLDGSTFALVIDTKSRDRAQVQSIVDAMLGQVEQPLKLDGHSIQIRLNIGLVASSQVARNGETLMSAAESALDIAKPQSSSNITWFSSALARDIARSRLIERHLWHAIERDELSVRFQPLVMLADRQVIGAEALVRWKNDALGDISPAEFIPVAESSGAIHDIGQFVLRESCRAALDWPDHVSVAVNVSPVQLDFSDMGKTVMKALSDTGLKPSRLHLELTETSLMTNHEFVIEQILALRLLGVKIALDDFGTGHSSFEYLARLPIDKIKIDQSFVRKMLKDNKSQPIIQAVLGLANGLNLDTVCEGIETDEHAMLLRLAGCNQGQGYLFGKPMTRAEFGLYLAKAGTRAGSEGAAAAPALQA